MLLLSSLVSVVLLALVEGLTTPELRHRSIYQILTDRFARPDDVLAPCDLLYKPYCGGTWKGIERKLDYIQGMGFDTGQCSLFYLSGASLTLLQSGSARSS